MKNISVKVDIRKGATTRSILGSLQSPMAQAAEHMKGVAKALVSTPYPPASPPRRPPHMRTGNLRNSIGRKKKNLRRQEVYAGISYSSELEYGHHNVASRPFMRPMMLRVRDSVSLFFRRAF